MTRKCQCATRWNMHRNKHTKTLPFTCTYARFTRWNPGEISSRTSTTFGSWPISYHAESIRIVKTLHLCVVSKVVLITTVNTFCGYASTYACTYASAHPKIIVNQPLFFLLLFHCIQLVSSLLKFKCPFTYFILIYCSICSEILV